MIGVYFKLQIGCFGLINWGVKDYLGYFRLEIGLIGVLKTI